MGLLGRGLQRSLAGLSYSGAAGDVGALWNPYGGWKLGLAAQHLGGLGALSQEADPAPMTFRGGLAWVHEPQDGLAFTGELDAVQPRDSAVQARVGFEAGWSYFFARAGAQWSQAYDGTQPFSVGAGLRFSSWQVDYSFAEMQDLGTAQRFGLSWRLDGAYRGRKGLQAPGGLAIKRDGKDLVLSWDASPNAAGYAVYLRKGQDQDLLRAGQTKASQTHLRLKKAGSLPFLGLAVSTLGEDGQESPLSDELRVGSGEDQAAEVPRPSGLQLKMLDGKRALQWSGPEGADYSYQVLVSRRSGNGYAALGKPVVQLQNSCQGAMNGRMLVTSWCRPCATARAARRPQPCLRNWMSCPARSPAWKAPFDLERTLRPLLLASLASTAAATGWITAKGEATPQISAREASRAGKAPWTRQRPGCLAGQRQQWHEQGRQPSRHHPCHRPRRGAGL